MTSSLNTTHDPAVRSRVASAQRSGTDFPLQNLPFGVFRRRAADETPRVGVAIGDEILDLARAHELGLLEHAGSAAAACQRDALNELMSLGPGAWTALRAAVWAILREGDPRLDGHEAELLVPQGAADLLLPARIGDYTDFYCSIHHATNVGRLFRPDDPLLPNYKHLPVGYHGRASSVVVSGTPIRRPAGQTLADGAHSDETGPTFGPTARLDYEAEVGFFAGPENALGGPVPIAEAEDHLFGFCLVNDWSARDIQKWEYQPLGPFLAKSFATTISPWVVTAEALAPYRVPAFERAANDPRPLPHLDSKDNRDHGGVDLVIEAHIRTANMREAGDETTRLSRGHFRQMYWTAAQMLTHHASNGCNLRPGDLLASGTVSGPEKENRGCLLELTTGGRDPVDLPSGERRTFLADGDEILLRGHCERATDKPGAVRIGFGECRGIVEAASS